jgi:hypothetical protein
MLNEMLEELRLDCKLCKIERGYKSAADYGIIVGFNDEWVCIKKYGRDGLYDGLKIFMKSDVEEIIFNGNELNARTKFIQNQGANLDPVDLDYSGFDEFMMSASKKYGYVCLNDDREDRCYIGPIIGFDEKYVHIKDHGNPTRRDRFDVLIAKSEIHSIDVDDVYERNLMSLYNS